MLTVQVGNVHGQLSGHSLQSQSAKAKTRRVQTAALSTAGVVAGEAGGWLDWRERVGWFSLAHATTHSNLPQTHKVSEGHK